MAPDGRQPPAACAEPPGPPALTSAEHAVLDLATEDNFGLWDVLWYLRGSLRLDEARARDAAIEAVTTLRERGLVELFTSAAPGAPDLPVAATGEAVELASRELWRRPAEYGREVLVGVTDAGERAFRAAERRRDR